MSQQNLRAALLLQLCQGPPLFFYGDGTFDQVIPIPFEPWCQVGEKRFVKMNSFNEQSFVHTSLCLDRNLGVKNCLIFKSPLAYNVRQLLHPTWFHLHFLWSLELGLVDHDRWNCFWRTGAKYTSSIPTANSKSSPSHPEEVKICEGVCPRSTCVPFQRFCEMCLIKINDHLQHIVPESDLGLQIMSKKQWWEWKTW